MEKSESVEKIIDNNKKESFSVSMAFRTVLVFFVAMFISFSVGIGIRKLMSNDYVSYNGWLKTNGSKVTNQYGKEFQLKGISTHGIQWFSDLYTYDDIKELKDMGITVFRIAMYTDPEADGYVKNNALKEKVYELVDACIDLDIYVIVDWHILNDNNPLKYKDQANEFFNEVSSRYANKPNVIYEICNEPNGNTGWNDIKDYAKDVISTIRRNSPNALVIVGTPSWSTDLAAVTNDPLNFENIAYTLHFYAGSHNATLRDKISEFRSKGYAVFVSECGITDASGDGKIFEDNFSTWISYLNENKISWVFWSLSNKAESSSILKSDYQIKTGDERWSIKDNLSETGEVVMRYFKRNN